MDGRNVKILVIDDIQDNLISMQAVIKESFPSALILTALNGLEGIKLASSEDPDVILLDILMPHMDGFEVCKNLKADKVLGNIPVVFITALKSDKTTRIRALEAGGDAFISKPIDETELTAQIRAMVKIKKATREKRDEKEQLAALVEERTLELKKNYTATVKLLEDLHKENAAREKIEKDLRESETKYRLLFDNAVEGIFQATPDGRFLSANPSLVSLFGFNSSQDLFEHVKDIGNQLYLYPGEWDNFKRIIEAEGVIRAVESQIIKKDGSVIWVSLNATTVRDDRGAILYFEGFMEDITGHKQDQEEKEKLQAQLTQAQKMESIGTLAGGIAHDFNNILFPILGYTEMLLDDLPEDAMFRESLNVIYTGALRARDLVQQILAFSRQGNNELRLMKMQFIIKEALKLIRSTIPTTISITQNLQADCRPVKADPTQIHQIVMNLTTNAYHAMEENGGELNVTLKEIEVGDYDLINPDMIPGLYACLIVSDTGMGINKEVMNRIFDPFFTTKKNGKGTGMGLSVVHGIVKGMNGEIQVYSKPGKGCEFHVYLPVVGSVPENQASSINKPLPGGVERIFLVDDEEAIIAMEQQILERLGYHVTSRICSMEALEAFRADPDKFDLIITDMSMPKMPGDKLAVEIIKIRPDIPILLCTGFSESLTDEKIKSLGIKGLLMKPIVIRALAEKIREVLAE